MYGISSPLELSSSWSCQCAQRSASVDRMSSDNIRPRQAVTPTLSGNLVGRHGSASILQTTRVVPLISWVNFRVIQPGTKRGPFTVPKQKGWKGILFNLYFINNILQHLYCFAYTLATKTNVTRLFWRLFSLLNKIKGLEFLRTLFIP